MPSPSGKIGPKALTHELRKLASMLHMVAPDGTEFTKEASLAELLWKQALGYEELYKDEYDKLVRKYHPPVAWAAQFIWERLEGKAPIAMSENEGGMKAADKVRELARDRVNALTKKVTVTQPPVYRAKKKQVVA